MFGEIYDRIFKIYFGNVYLASSELSEIIAQGDLYLNYFETLKISIG